MNQTVNNGSEAAREWNTSGNNNAPVTVEIPLELRANGAKGEREPEGAGRRRER